MNESSYLTLLGKLEHSDSWGFGDAFELLCFHIRVYANGLDLGREQFFKVDMSLRDVWTTIEDAISEGKIRVTNGKLSDLSEGPFLTNNSNIVSIDKKSFLSWYRRDKEKIVQYLSCVNLKIYQEEFLDRLAKAEPTKSPHPKTKKAKMDQLREDYISVVTKKLKDNPNLQFPDIKDDYRLLRFIRGSGLPDDKRPKNSTLQKWLRDTRKKVNAKPKHGARKKAK
jgi:hypothetical protein